MLLLLLHRILDEVFTWLKILPWLCLNDVLSVWLHIGSFSFFTLA